MQTLYGILANAAEVALFAAAAAGLIIAAGVLL